MVLTFSKKLVGSQKIAPNFKISEFACKDGSDEILIDTDLVVILQQIRDHFNTNVNINSGYRSPAHNKAVGGSTSSLHLKGLYAAELLGTKGGIEIGDAYTHIDVRPGRWRAFTKSGGSQYTTVTDFGPSLKRV